MTREEAIRELRIQFLGEYNRQREAKDMGIKALEQESMLDKIRTEIGKALSDETISDNSQLISDVGIGLELALSIINKYMVEREEE